MKIILISDTHGNHNFRIPKGDVLIHAGDVSSRGRKTEIDAFIKWFQSQPHKHKIFIAGNHDFYFEEAIKNNIEINFLDLIYLNDSGCEIDGIKFWGSPIQPTFFDWAFNRKRGEEIKKHWDLIPNDTDVLITHGPPHKILDLTKKEEYVGCKELKNKVLEIKPKLHVFGHIHEAYGKTVRNNTVFVNASLLDNKYRNVNSPIEIEL
ncbi:metallophosphatase domain-containing protein [Polaribacter haliotis]|uniref:Metallophosphatase domain-containing protein n=1 Tax=Polaribacter haliotis TaxID=1888915 RepID=A0A7L8AG11_9FLAO|nr:metallophosphatase domain-containing protein [Polaribacter haliotis]QOD60890.1 metallophosphatase domain-containing protein [Polaribacter haliotis]